MAGGELSNNKGINKAGGGPDRAGADRQGHGGHQDRDELPVRVPGGELPEERHRHGDGAPARQRGRRDVAPQAGADRQDRAQRGDPGARPDPARVRRHHGRARRPGGRGRQRGGAGAAETHDPHGARDGQGRHHRDADDGVDDRQPGADPRRGQRRGQRGARRHRRGDAERRNGDRQVPGGDDRADGRDRARGRGGRRRDAGDRLHQQALRPHRPVDRDGRAVHRAPPGLQGDPGAHRVGFDARCG